MKLTFLTLTSLLAAASAYAHEGHVAPVEGHAHWDLAILPLVAIAAGILFWVLRAKSTDK